MNFNEYINSQNIILASMPFISGAIGWFTNFIAVKMLLKPIRPIKILGIYSIQGLLPKRHHELANRISAAIAKDFLTEENIIDFIKNAKTGEIMKQYIQNKWNDIIGDISQLIPMLPMLLPEDKLEGVRDTIAESLSRNTGDFVHLLADGLAGKIDLEETIKNNILDFDLERLESIIEEIAKREFRYIERLGGMIGFMIGALQAVLVLLFF